LWAGSSARFQVLVQSEQCTGRNALGLLRIERPPYTRKPSRFEDVRGGRMVAGSNPARPTLTLHSGIMRALVVVSGFLLL